MKNELWGPSLARFEVALATLARGASLRVGLVFFLKIGAPATAARATAACATAARATAARATAARATAERAGMGVRFTNCFPGRSVDMIASKVSDANRGRGAAIESA